MENKAVEKEIDNLIQKRGALSTYTFLLTGGIVGIFLTLHSIVQFILIIAGIFIGIIFLKGLLNIEDRINLLIKELRK